MPKPVLLYLVITSYLETI